LSRNSKDAGAVEDPKKAAKEATLLARIKRSQQIIAEGSKGRIEGPESNQAMRSTYIHVSL
jgi:hypothetical protein